MLCKKHDTVYRVNTQTGELMKGIVIGVDPKTERCTVSWEKFEYANSYDQDDLSSSAEIAEAKFATWHQEKFGKKNGK